MISIETSKYIIPEPRFFPKLIVSSTIFEDTLDAEVMTPPISTLLLFKNGVSIINFLIISTYCGNESANDLISFAPIIINGTNNNIIRIKLPKRTSALAVERVIFFDSFLTSGSNEHAIKKKKKNIIAISGIFAIKTNVKITAIAKKYNTTVKAIAEKNGIKNVNLIITGQKLKI